MRQWTIDIIPLEAQRLQSEVRPHRNVPINQSINQSIKTISDKTEQKQPGPVVAGCILWPQLTARKFSVGVTQSLHTAERHAQRDGTGSGFHSAFLYRTRGVAFSQVRGRATSGCEYRGGRVVGVGSHAHGSNSEAEVRVQQSSEKVVSVLNHEPTMNRVAGPWSYTQYCYCYSATPNKPVHRVRQVSGLKNNN